MAWVGALFCCIGISSSGFWSIWIFQDAKFQAKSCTLIATKWLLWDDVWDFRRIQICTQDFFIVVDCTHIFKQKYSSGIGASVHCSSKKHIGNIVCIVGALPLLYNYPSLVVGTMSRSLNWRTSVVVVPSSGNDHWNRDARKEVWSHKRVSFWQRDPRLLVLQLWWCGCWYLICKCLCYSYFHVSRPLTFFVRKGGKFSENSLQWNVFTIKIFLEFLGQNECKILKIIVQIVIFFKLQFNEFLQNILYISYFPENEIVQNIFHIRKKKFLRWNFENFYILLCNFLREFPTASLNIIKFCKPQPTYDIITVLSLIVWYCCNNQCVQHCKCAKKGRHCRNKIVI